MNNAGLTNTDLYSTTLIPTTWCPPVVTVVITPSVLVSQTHDISMPAPTTYTFPAFTLDIVCSDASTIVYSATALDGITLLPLFITLDPLTLTFSIFTQNILDVTATPIDVLLTATSPTGQTQTA